MVFEPLILPVGFERLGVLGRKNHASLMEAAFAVTVLSVV